MRFPRQAKIFRGQLDPAPVAAVFFLLIAFVLLGSLLYTPGVLIELNNSAVAPGQAISVSRKGEISFGGKTYLPADMEQLRADLQAMPGPKALTFRSDSGADPELVAKIREILLVEPPLATDFQGVDGPTMIVAVNFRGQFFYENQLVGEKELRARLSERLKEAKDLTLVLLADKAVANGVVVRLCSLAREVGVSRVLQATRPGASPVAPLP